MKFALKLLSVSLAFSTALLLPSCGFLKILDDRAEKGDITGFVYENEKLLTNCIESGDYTALDSSKIIQDIDDDGDLVEFNCGGAGFGSATQYRGFYYSEDDDMTALWCAPKDEPLTESEGGYFWREANGDDSYYTENITGHFYYYEASY